MKRPRMMPPGEPGHVERKQREREQQLRERERPVIMLSAFPWYVSPLRSMASRVRR